MGDLETDEDASLGFPGWQGPIVAGAMFGALALFTDSAQWNVSGPVWFAGHIMVGATIGLLVSLCDGPGPGTLMSRFLALISVVTALLPVFGLPFNLAAFWMNRHHPGFHRTLSRVTLTIAVLTSIVLPLALLIASTRAR